MISNNRTYRVIVVGPTGAGKSQFCNFVQKDKTNSINKVSDSLDSCTREPFSNFFQRQNTDYEFIDTIGNSDSSNDDMINLQNLVSFLKDKKSIDYIIFLLKFNERVTKDTREYIKTLGKIFTPGEFYNHLCVVFTKYPVKPSTKEVNIKKKTIAEINGILKDSFNIKRNQKIPDINVYFIDSEINEEKGDYEEIYQDTIDILLENMKLKVEINGPINTINLDITGESVKSRVEVQKKEIIKLQEMLEEEKKKKEKEEKDKERLKKEIERIKKNNDIRRKKENKLYKIIQRQNEERKKLEKWEEYNRKYEENYRRQKAIEEEARKKGIEIEKLDNIIDRCGEVAEKSIMTFCFGGLIIGGGLLTNILCPPLAIVEAMALSGLAIETGSLITLGSTGIVAGISKIYKEFLKLDL